MDVIFADIVSSMNPCREDSVVSDMVVEWVTVSWIVCGTKRSQKKRTAPTPKMLMLWTRCGSIRDNPRSRNRYGLSLCKTPTKVKGKTLCSTQGAKRALSSARGKRKLSYGIAGMTRRR
eukprot:scaffold1667_cov173-Amphora_coffeaeformis.AAC.17